jgi:MFS family permease
MLQDGPDPASPSNWKALLRGGRAKYSVLLNFGVLLHAINLLVVSTVMPSVVADIGGLPYYAWPSMLYMVGTVTGAACGEPALAALQRRNAYVLAAALVGTGAVITATAPSMPVVIAGQLVQGFGGGLLTALSMAIVRFVFAEALRVRILSVISTTWSVAAILGPALGGMFADMGWWRGAFWFSALAAVPFAIVSWRMFPPDRGETAAARWPILRLMLLALAVISLGFTGQVESKFAASVLLAVSVALTWMTFRLDSKSEHQLYPSGAMSAFSPVGAAYLAMFLLSVSHAAALLFLPLALEVLYGVSPLWVGVFFTVFSAAWTIGALTVASWGGRRAHHAMFWGMMLVALSTAAIAFEIGAAPIWYLVVLITVFGIGIGLANVHMIAWAMAAAVPGEEAVTASSLQSCRSLGVAFGFGLAGLVANLAGVGAGVATEVVAEAMTWIYSLDILPPILAALFVLRMLALAAARDSAARG